MKKNSFLKEFFISLMIYIPLVIFNSYLIYDGNLTKTILWACFINLVIFFVPYLPPMNKLRKRAQNN